MNALYRIALVALSSFFLAQTASAATIIDNFEEGDFSVSDDTLAGTPTFGEQSGLLTSNVAGGVRLVRVIAGGTAGIATAALTTTPDPVDDSAQLTTIGINSPADYAFIYDGIANGSPDGFNGALGLDLSGDDQIRIEIVSASLSATLQVVLADSSFASSQASTPVPVVLGANVIALSAFPSINLSDIQQIRVNVLGVGLLDNVSISNIQAIPEPGTALLLATGLVGVAWRRRSSR